MNQRKTFREKTAANAKRQQESRSSYGYLNLPRNVMVFSPEPGSRVKLDFLPYVVTDEKHPDRDDENEIALPGTLWYKRPFKVHRNIGVNNETYVCRTSIGERCPICEYRTKRIREGAEKEETDLLKPSMRNLYIVVPLDSKKHEEGIYIMDVSQFLLQNLLNEELRDNPDNGIFPDLKEGLTLRIRFDSSTIGNSQPFAEASRIDFLERERVYDEEVLKDVPNLDEVLNVLSYSELESRFYEMDTTDRKEEDEDELPFRTGEDDEKKEVKHIGKPKVATVTKPTVGKPIAKERVVEEEKETDEEKEEVKVASKPKAEAKPKPVFTRNTPQKPQPNNSGCPHGHQLGKDFEKFDECGDCEKWDDCYDARNV